MDATDNTGDAARAKRDEAARATGIDPETGFAHDGEWPTNHRLRAEAMAKADVSTDPAGMVSDDLIASTKERLDRDDEAAAQAERDAAEAERAKPSLRWTEAKLREEAERLGVTVETDANKAAILAAIEAAPPAQGTEG